MTMRFRRAASRTWTLLVKVLLLAALLAVAQVAAQPGDVVLPPPQTDGGMPLLTALSQRQTNRNFADRPLPPQTLSNLLWAAFGINRPGSGGRTAPSARNWQEIDIYVAMADGLFVFDAKSHALKRVQTQDLRPRAGTQRHAREAPLTLVYVADERRMPGANEETRRTYAAADTGFIAQNVYLFCASEGLATVVFASIDRERFAQAAGLRPEQRITLAQSVGYPRQ